MKPALIFPLLLAGLALAGCNSATRSNTATETNSFVTPAPEPIINPVASPASPPSTSSTSAPDATYNNSLQSSSATTSANNVDSAETSLSTPASPSTELAVTSSLPSSTYSSIDASRTTPTSTPDAVSTTEATAPETLPQPTIDVAASATQTPPVPSPDTSLTAQSDRIPATVTPSDLPKTSSESSFAEPVASSTLTGDISGRLTEWKLNTTDIQADLDRGATITRSKNDVVGAPTGASDDDVVETMVKGKLQADLHTSSAKIDVDAANGEVTLKGTAANADAIGRAVALSLDTQGVTKVSSDLKLSTAETPSAEANAATPPPQN